MRLRLRSFFMVCCLLMATSTQAGVVRITVNGSISSASAGMGYTVGDAVSFYWDVNDYAPEAPVGSMSTSGASWTQEDDSQPLLFAGAGGTGIGGSYREPDDYGPYERLATWPNPSSGYDISAEVKTDSFDVSLKNHGIYLTANNSYFIKELKFSDRIGAFPLSAFFSGPVPNPATFLSNYFGTYTATASSTSGANAVIASNGSQMVSAAFITTSVSISSLSAASVPEPSTWALGVGGLALAAWRRRKQSGR